MSDAVEIVPPPGEVRDLRDLGYMSEDVRAKFTALYGWRIRQLEAAHAKAHPAAPPAAQPPAPSGRK